MNNEGNNIFNDDISTEKTVEVEKIIEFYKDKEYVQEDTTAFKESDTEIGEIQSEVHGLTQKTRLNLYRVISAAVSSLIIIAAFVLAYYLPGNESVIAEHQDELRNDKDYVSLKSRHDTLKTEIENLKTNNKEKSKQVQQITDIDNTKAKLRTDITAKSHELNELNKQIEEKRNVIAQLDNEIGKKAASEIVLPPGKYIVGKNIAAGKYQVTGSGTFAISNAQGKAKINTTLSSTALNIVLEDNDIMKFFAKVKFTSAN